MRKRQSSSLGGKDEWTAELRDLVPAEVECSRTVLIAGTAVDFSLTSMFFIYSDEHGRLRLGKKLRIELIRKDNTGRLAGLTSWYKVACDWK